MEELEKQSKELGEQLAKATAASEFESSAEGKLAIDYLEKRASAINTKIIGSKPLDRDEYLNYHGRLAEINGFMAMLRNTQNINEATRQRKRDIDGQLDEIRKQTGTE